MDPERCSGGGEASLQRRTHPSGTPWSIPVRRSPSCARATRIVSGIRLLSDRQHDVGTSTDIKVASASRAGLLPRLDVGGITVFDHAVLILPGADLDPTLPDGRPLLLRGILGGTLLRELRVVLDFVPRSATLEPSTGRNREDANFFWLGYPVVRVTAATGQSLLFGLDTGSRNTSMSRLPPEKTELGELRKETQIIGGAGGSVEVETDVASRVELVIDGCLVLPDVRREDHDDVYFLESDGMLGSDLAQGVVLTIDYLSGIFGIALRD